MEIFVQQIVNGLVLGSIYALVALGYTMVYGILGLINFAHGDITMIGALVALTVAQVMAAAGLPVPLILAAAGAAAILVCAVIGLTVERVAYRPLRRAPRLAPQRDESRRGLELNLSTRYAYGVWRPLHGVAILSDGSAPTS